MASICTPSFSAIFAIVGAFLWSSSQPRRVFKVTGIETAFTTAETISCTATSSCIKADPDSRFVTFLAGQPILMSTNCAPLISAKRAASAIICGSHPAIWIESGASSCSTPFNFCISIHTSCKKACDAIISETTSPPPHWRTICRKGLSVIPDIGANITL